MKTRYHLQNFDCLFIIALFRVKFFVLQNQINDNVSYQKYYVKTLGGNAGLHI